METGNKNRQKSTWVNFSTITWSGSRCTGINRWKPAQHAGLPFRWWDWNTGTQYAQIHPHSGKLCRWYWTFNEDVCRRKFWCAAGSRVERGFRWNSKLLYVVWRKHGRDNKGNPTCFRWSFGCRRSGSIKFQWPCGWSNKSGSSCRRTDRNSRRCFWTGRKKFTIRKRNQWKSRRTWKCHSGKQW